MQPTSSPSLFQARAIYNEAQSAFQSGDLNRASETLKAARKIVASEGPELEPFSNQGPGINNDIFELTNKINKMSLFEATRPPLPQTPFSAAAGPAATNEQPNDIEQRFDQIRGLIIQACDEMNFNKFVEAENRLSNIDQHKPTTTRDNAFYLLDLIETENKLQNLLLEGKFNYAYNLFHEDKSECNIEAIEQMHEQFLKIFSSFQGCPDRYIEQIGRDLYYQRLEFLNSGISQLKLVQSSFIGSKAQSQFDLLEITKAKKIQSPSHCALPFTRDPNIACFDHSRVRIVEDPEFYYHANRVFPGIIAAQGPMDHECDKFWQMIFQKDIPTIVMVTDFEEEDFPKCSRYLANGQYGSYTVQPINEEVIELNNPQNSLVKTTLQISNGQASKFVIHFHLRGWKSNGVISESTLAKTIQTVYEHNGARDLLVHCSDGIGQTGTFIAPYQAFREAHESSFLHYSPNTIIYNLTIQMRQNRDRMIPVLPQYVLAYATARKLIPELFESPQPQGKPFLDEDEAYSTNPIPIMQRGSSKRTECSNDDAQPALAAAAAEPMQEEAFGLQPMEDDEEPVDQVQTKRKKRS